MTGSQRRARQQVDARAAVTGRPRPGGGPPKQGGGRTPRSVRTRQSLVEAAREVFERDGFMDARVTDIAAAAGVAHGTFYTYFRSKHDVFREVVMAVAADMAIPAAVGSQPLPPAELIESAIRHYLSAYRRNWRVLATLEQVGAADDEIRAQRSDARRAFVDGAAARIALWQEQALALAELDPRYAASALGGMVDRFAYVWMVLGEQYEEERVVDTLTRIWVAALGVGQCAPPAGPRGRKHRKVS